MNKVPLKFREQGRLLLRDNLLNELVQFKKNPAVPTGYNHDSNINNDEWRELLNYCILTKLSSFRIHHELNLQQLDKLIEITANSLESENKNLDFLINKIDENAVLLKNWLNQINQQIKLKK